MRTCTDCEIEFKIKHTKKGRIDQCDDCSQADTTQRYIGYNDGQLNKMSHTGIYRGADKSTIKRLTKSSQRVG